MYAIKYKTILFILFIQTAVNQELTLTLARAGYLTSG